MKNSFERIVRSTPVDKRTAVVAGAKGDHWEAKITGRAIHSALPIPTIPPDPRHPDLTGVVNGRLTTIGYYGYGRWVVRCRCGAYEVRRTRSIREKRGLHNWEAMCSKCDYWHQLKNPVWRDYIEAKNSSSGSGGER